MPLPLPTGGLGRALAVAILLAALVFAWLVVVSPLRALYRERADELTQDRILAGKMSATAAMMPRMKAEAINRANTAGPPSLLLRGASDALAAADLQEMLTRAASATGVVLLSAEGTSVESVGAVRRIGLKISGSGRYTALVDFLSRVDQSATPLLVDELQIQGWSQQTGTHTLARLTVYAFRAGDKGK